MQSPDASMPITDEGTPKAATNDKVIQTSDGTEVLTDVARNHVENETLPSVAQDSPENDTSPAEQAQGLGLILEGDGPNAPETSNLAAADGANAETIVTISATSTTIVKGDDGRDRVVK